MELLQREEPLGNGRILASVSVPDLKGTGPGSGHRQETPEPLGKRQTDAFIRSGYRNLPEINWNRSPEPISESCFRKSREISRIRSFPAVRLRPGMIKNPKTFQGGKDDVNRWLDDIEHLFDIAPIPDANKLDFISFSFRREALH